MTGSTLDALLHPVRWRVVQALAAGPRTLRDVRSDLPEVPQATLYRQLQPLLDAGVVEVASETPVRGAVERTYRLTGAGVDGRELGLDDHRRAFLFLQTVLLKDVEHYLDAPGADPAADGLSYTHATVHVTDAERAALVEGLQRLIEPHLAPTSPDARPLGIGLVMVPGATGADPDVQGRPGAHG